VIFLSWIKSRIRRRRTVAEDHSIKEDTMLLRILLGAAALAVSALAAGQPIRVGAFLSVTGPAAFLGDPEQKTLELYVGKLNAAGGVLGRRLELIAYDSAGDAEKARGYVKRLIEQD
jgi:branched-chain amino acid transport system substrate-binding protein